MLGTLSLPSRRRPFAGPPALLALAALLVSFLWNAGPLPLVAADPPAPNFDSIETALRDAGVDPSEPGIIAYLQSGVPDAAAHLRIQALFVQLGDDQYPARQEASSRLVVLPALPADLLDDALASPNPEVNLRAHLIAAERASFGSASVTLANCFNLLQRRRIRGAVEPMLGLIPAINEPYLSRLACRALAACSFPADEKRLRDALASDKPALRMAATAALGSALGGKAVPTLLELLGDAQDGVRLEACRALANQGRREALRPLAALLRSGNAAISGQAHMILRSATRAELDFSPDDSAADRARKAGAWDDWIRVHPDVSLVFPLKDGPMELGRTIFCNYAANTVTEIDSKGTEIFSAKNLGQPWGCTGTPDGHRLVAVYNTREIVEFDNAGKEVWRQKNLPGGPMSVQRLESGNTLAACADGARVVEYRHDGTVAWERVFQGRPTDAHRLETGNTLVVLQNLNVVVEVDRSGAEVWKQQQLANPLTAQRLENGNTLITEMGSGRVVEVDRAHNIVWSRDHLQSPYDSQRLPNDTTLVADAQGLHIFNRAGVAVWERRFSGVSRCCRY